MAVYLNFKYVGILKMAESLYMAEFLNLQHGNTLNMAETLDFKVAVFVKITRRRYLKYGCIFEFKDGGIYKIAEYLNMAAWINSAILWKGVLRF
jgi:hypothetical protein